MLTKAVKSIQPSSCKHPKCPKFNGRPTFANPKYLKKAQSEIPCLYEIPHDQSDPTNRLVPDREETLTLERESRSKLNKDLVKPYDYTKEIVNQAWVKHSKDHLNLRAPTAHDMQILIKTCLMPLALKTQNDSFAFVHELKQEKACRFKIPIGQRFSPNKSSNVYLKTTPPRYGLTWKPTGRIFTQVGLKWIPIRKPVETRHNTNDSASPLGKETHNPKTVICANSSSLSEGTSMASEPISSKGSSNMYWIIHMKKLAGLDRVVHDVYAIIHHIGPKAKRRSSHIVIAKLVVAASAYFIWQERNWRLFKKTKRTVNQVIECIKSAVRLKLLSCSFKRYSEGVRYARMWDLPNTIFKC
ncbi:hypothetical protein Tco_0679913 [Tanacetum coccineum]|uniref:Reverse transcriptase zinc-binding domain-containing protein n=1 Tax=Tanacetum coccineum TaxID=301880 RepID=A0ABQ4XJ52_9ASTR